MTSPARRLRAGFTLTEIAIVLGVIGLIVAGIWTAASTVQDRTRTNNAISEYNLVTSNMSTFMTGGYGSGASLQRADANAYGNDAVAGVAANDRRRRTGPRNVDVAVETKRDRRCEEALASAGPEAAGRGNAQYVGSRRQHDA